MIPIGKDTPRKPIAMARARSCQASATRIALTTMVPPMPMPVTILQTTSTGQVSLRLAASLAAAKSTTAAVNV